MVYNIGEIVLVDGQNKAYIECVEAEDDEDDELKFRVKYLVADIIEHNVSITRLTPTILAGSTRSERNLFIPQSYTNTDASIEGRRRRHTADDTTTATAISSLTAATSSSTSVSSSSLRVSPPATSNTNTTTNHQQQSHGTTPPTTSTTTTTSNNNNPTTPANNPTTPPANANHDDNNHLLNQVKKVMKEAIDFIPLKRNRRSSTNNSNNTNHPLFEFLQSKFNDNNTAKGWIRCLIREEEQEDINNDTPHRKKKHLSAKEKNILITIISLFAGFASTNGPLQSWKRYVIYAFDITYRTLKRVYEIWVDRVFAYDRKIRKDKGDNVFNSPAMRKATFTAFNIYKKHRYSNFRDCMGRMSSIELRNGFNSLTDTERSKYEIEAQQCLLRSTYLWEELKDILLKSKGKVSYEAFASYLKHIVSANTIRNVLCSKEGFYLRHDKMLPHLDQLHKEKRYKWAQRYLTFWEAVKKVPSNKCLYVLVHMDEKWFYACKTRSNCKVLTSIGMVPVDYYVHHKSHVGKEMYITVTAYALNENDISKGGTAIPISLLRVGKDGEYKKDTYHRQYDNNGRYTMPSEPWNLKNKKGDYKWENGILTGATEGASKKGPKISLLKKYQDEIIPSLMEKVVEKYKYNDGSMRDVRIVLQEDGAGPHNCVIYNRWMDRKFDELGWVRFNQPPQSPVTNIHDACIFPMLSKNLSREQAINFNARLLVGNQIRESVNKCYYDKENRLAMSRAFAGNHQIAMTILAHKGDNNYLREKGGLSFGIRKTFMRDPEGDGVIVFNRAATQESETSTGNLLMNASGLRYEYPDVINDFYGENVTLSRQQKKVLKEDYDKHDVNIRCEMEEGFWYEMFEYSDDDKKEEEELKRGKMVQVHVVDDENDENDIYEDDDEDNDQIDWEYDEDDDNEYYDLEGNSVLRVHVPTAL